MGRQSPNTDAYAQPPTQDRQQSQASQTSLGKGPLRRAELSRGQRPHHCLGNRISINSPSPPPATLRTAGPQCPPAANADAQATNTPDSGADSLPPSSHDTTRHRRITCPSRLNVPPMREDRWSCDGKKIRGERLDGWALAYVLKV